MGSWEGIEMGYVLDAQGERTGEIVTRAEWVRRQSEATGRLRTAHDQDALEGKVPFVHGGNPTPAERLTQAEYDAAQAARMREAIPTLAEAMAADTWVTGADGSLMPKRLADRGEQGWDGPSGAAADRDSTQAARLAVLVKDMDAKVLAWLSDADQGIDEAEDICRTWQSIRKITQGRD